MAVFFSDPTKYLVRDASFIPPGSLTYCYWRLITTDAAPSGGRTNHVLFSGGDSSPSDQYDDPYLWDGQGNGVADFEFYGVDDTSYGPSYADYYAEQLSIPLGVWEHVAVVYNVAAQTIAIYVNGLARSVTYGGLGSGHLDFSSIQFTSEFLGSDPGFIDAPSPDNSHIGVEYHRMWSATLTQAEIQAEMASRTAVRRLSLIANARLADVADLTDEFGHDWTDGSGSPTSIEYIDGPLPPANTTPETATVIASLPYDLADDPQDAPEASVSDGLTPSCTSSRKNELWWRYTVSAGVRELTLLSDVLNRAGASSYTPSHMVWTGDPSVSPLALTPYEVNGNGFCFTGLGGYWIQMPVTPGDTLWFQIVDDAFAPADLIGNQVRLRLRAAPQVVAPAGALVIPSDEDDFPAAILDARDGSFLQVRPFPAGEFTDTLPTGEICTQNGEADHGIAFLDRNWNTVATVDFGVTSNVFGISSDKNATFFVFVNETGTLRVRSYSAAGVAGAFRTMPDNNARQYAVDRSGDVICHARSGANQAIKRFSFVSNAALSDLHAGFAGESARDMFVHDDGTIVIGFFTAGSKVGFRLFDAAGSVLGSYNYYDASTSNAFNHLATADDGETLWLWALHNNLTPTYLKQIRIADGEVLTAIGPIATTASEWLGSGEVDRPWAVSNSCPIFVLTQSLPVAGLAGDGSDDSDVTFENAKPFIGLALIHLTVPD